MMFHGLVVALALMLGTLAPAARATEVMLSEGDLVPVGRIGWSAPRLVLPPPDPVLPMVRPWAEDPAAGFLLGLAARRLAAGFGGVIYDNRDRGHSILPPDRFPGLARLVYGPDLRRAGLDLGLGGAIVLPAIVLGNSSTAVRKGPMPRSLPRLAMTTDPWPARSFRAYASNHIYVYPEHRDHDAADLFPASWPYMVTSQGSSGSDEPFLRAIAMTLAAFPPDTRDRLQREGLIAPAIQMILRRSQKQVTSREAYFTGTAHPSVFDADQLQPERMVGLAAAMRPETIPPMVRLTVVSEDFQAETGLARQSERLFDTPSAIARLWRGPEGRHEMVISAAETRDPNDRPLRFRWELLRGDPARVRIEPLDAAGTSVRLVIDWQQVPDLPAAPPDRAATRDGTQPVPRPTARIDIGIFASNGAQDSAPAFVSVALPAHEARVYAPGPDGAPRLVSVDYDALGRGAAYDPQLYWSAPWNDTYVYDAQGNPDGWIRQGAKGTTRFDASGQPVSGPAPDYRIDRRKADRPVLRSGLAADGPAPPPDRPSRPDRPGKADVN